MFLEQPGKTLPAWTDGVVFTDQPLKSDILGGRKPRHLQVLGRSMWPKEVIKRIVAIYEGDGIDVEEQKLVEPNAWIFGGIDRDGEPDFTHVDWDLAVEYFTWERESLMGTDKAESLQAACEKKRGGRFDHYPVYEDRRAVYGGE